MRWLLLIPFALIAFADDGHDQARAAFARLDSVCAALEQVYQSGRVKIVEQNGESFHCNFTRPSTGDIRVKLKRIAPTSPCASFNEKEPGLIVPGDTLIVPDRVHPGMYGIVVEPDCHFSYDSRGDWSPQWITGIEIERTPNMHLTVEIRRGKFETPEPPYRLGASRMIRIEVK